MWLDGAALKGSHGLGALVRDWGAWSVRAGVAAALGFLIFGESRTESARIDLTGHRIAWPLLAAHAAAMAAFAALSIAVFAPHSTNMEVAAWLAAGIAGISLAACALIPPAAWIAMIRSMRDVLAFAILAGIVACVVGNYARALWAPLARLTFGFVSILLRPFVARLVASPATMTIGTPQFNVEIAPECSGYEGLGLILAVSSAWLWFTRRQWRFPQALLLIPAGIASIWVLNAARIAALILIGNAGAERIALGGFHSQAGWIAFCAVSLGVCAGARRVAWLNAADRTVVAEAAPNRTAAYLMPFLAILAAALLTRAATADFEWFYGLRVFSAGAALWICRRSYRDLDWRCGPAAFAMGAAVFALWIGLDRFLHIPFAAAPDAFQHASPALRIAWIVLRVFGAIVTAPIAEELAFRGFLMRRLAAADFESVDLSRFAWLPFLISSLAFGMLHGDRWSAGAVAGMFYAWAAIRQGRIGDAIAAHAFTNALLAAWVLATGNWQFW